MIGWRFPANNDLGLNGLKNPGTETFNDNIIKSLSKEICQNSLDAVNDKNAPVIVDFKIFNLYYNEVPDVGPFKRMLELQLKYAKENIKNDKSTEKFYNNALNILDAESIRCLRVSDFNTTGLEGSNLSGNTNWNNLVKSTGFSDKIATDGGSFGIGKFAPFSCSNFYTVFYSTFAKDNLHAFQGVARLSSFIDDTNNVTNGTGFYGYFDGLSPLQQTVSLDSTYNRNEYGTDLFILGFKSEDNWELEILAAVLESFFISIFENKLIVNTNNYCLSKDTILSVLEKIKEEDENLIDRHTNDYLSLIFHNAQKIKKYTYSMFENDDIRLILGTETNFNRRVAITRSNGMKIFNKGSLPQIADFTGILIVEGQKANAYFRQMENPQHNIWEPKRHPAPRIANEKLKELYIFIKKSIEDIASFNESNQMDIDGLGDLLPDILNKEATNGNKNGETEDIVVSEPKKINPKKIKIIVEEDTGELDADLNAGLSTNSGEEQHQSSDNDNKQRKVVLPKLVRAFASGIGYECILKGEFLNKNVTISFKYTGESNYSELANIMKCKIREGATLISYQRNLIRLKTYNETIKLFVELSRGNEWALEVVVYEN